MQYTKLRFYLLSALFAAVIATVMYSALMFFPDSVLAAQAGESLLPEGAIQWGFLAAAIATGASSIGAGIAVSSVGAAAVGVLAEKPELFGRVLVLVGLAEGIAIYGLIISIMILNYL
jgi:V/A-type H+-transporting ATPase subunit K